MGEIFVTVLDLAHGFALQAGGWGRESRLPLQRERYKFLKYLFSMGKHNVLKESDRINSEEPDGRHPAVIIAVLK